MLKQWLTPRDARETAEVGPAMVAVGVAIVVATAILECVQNQRITLLPQHGQATGNVIIGIVLPLLACGAMWWSKPRGPQNTANTMLAISVSTCIATLLWGFHESPITFMSFSLYCLTAFAVSYLWHTKTAIAFSSFSVGCLLLQLLSVLDSQQALSTWIACAMSLLGSCIALSLSRDRFGRIRKELQRKTMQDSLTGLASRRRVDRMMHRHEQNPTSEPCVSLMICDIDNFKSINDRFGHPGGDEALRRVGALMSAVADEADIPYRLGGDELAIYMPGKTLEQARATAVRITKTVNATPIPLPDGQAVEVSLTTGVAHTTNLATVRSLYAQADSALNSGKRNRKGRVYVTDPTEQQSAASNKIPTQPSAPDYSVSKEP